MIVDKKNRRLILLSVVFFLATSGLVYYSFFRPSKDQQLLASINPSPLINAEEVQEFPVDNKTAKEIGKDIRQELASAELKVNTVKYFYFTETLLVQTQSGPSQQKKLVITKDFFDKLEIPLPPAIVRTAKDTFMFGYHSFNGNQPFLILKTDYYDNAFAGMLGWESTMAGDLQPIFGTIGKENLSQRKWSDVVIQNKDTRVLYNFDNSIALVYMFKDQNTLIITTSSDTLFEISRRLDLSAQKSGV